MPGWGRNVLSLYFGALQCECVTRKPLPLNHRVYAWRTGRGGGGHSCAIRNAAFVGSETPNSHKEPFLNLPVMRPALMFSMVSGKCSVESK